MRKASIIALAGYLSLTVGAAVQAQQGVRIELNKLEPQDGACRAYLVFENNTGHTFTEYKLDLVMFDPDDVIARRLAVDAAPLRADKTTVKLFDIEGLDCGNIGRILVNDVLDCADDTGPRQNCVTEIEPVSKADVALVK
jgi:hypothetical protein